MNKLNTTLLILFFLTSISALAQDSVTIAPEQMALTILKKIDHEVGLSEEQEAEVLQLLIERSEEFARGRSQNASQGLKASFQSSGQGNADSGSAHKRANATAIKKMKKVLSKAQYEKWQAVNRAKQQAKEKYGKSNSSRSTQDTELDFQPETQK